MSCPKTYTCSLFHHTVSILEVESSRQGVESSRQGVGNFRPGVDKLQFRMQGVVEGTGRVDTLG